MRQIEDYIIEKFKIKNKQYENIYGYYETTHDIFVNYLDYDSLTLDDVKKYVKEQASIFSSAVATVYDWIEKNKIIKFKAYTSQQILNKSGNSKADNFIVDSYQFSKYLDAAKIRNEDRYKVFDEGEKAGIKIYIKDNILLYQEFNKLDGHSYTYAFVIDE